nr:NLI interacting factor-like phosphatase [Bacteriovorax sp. HI3]
MKWSSVFTFIFCLFLLFSCAHEEFRSPAQESAKPRHVVFDIDWTIVTEVTRESALVSKTSKNKRIIEVQGKHYYINDGLEEFVSEILSHPEMRVSFYSGGKKSRNEELLSKIKLKNGKSLKDIAYKILNNEDLIDVPGALPEWRFSEKHKKDLSKVSKDLSELIMFDDTAHFVFEGRELQSNHVFFIGTSFEYFDNFEEARNLSGEYIPKSYEEWLLNQKKLVVLMGAFKEAYQEAVDGKVSFAEAMKQKEELLNLKDHYWNEHSRRYFKMMGGRAPVQIKLPSNDCLQGMRVIMGL